ncbi:MAG: restriction endonuclease subunit R [Gallionellales bacterium RIFCSPLOWO2_12_FULL_59_22]|nr:MAG: restriction endonuclease subunit R [Gallionellales bacterium RIFCSPLOWO2_02_58_13]OGT10119.1 MAG: restriction endonuclease subunit R [Gallionellales bacterium RIFCSPLOWO2_12_FULL_59_22]
MPQTEAFARTLIDAQLQDQDWKISDGISVRYEYTLSDGDRADYMLCGREGRGLAIVEAKRESINAADAREQGRHNAEQAGVPFVFLANGKEVLFWDWEREAHPRPVKTFFSQSDLERRAAMRQMRVDPLGVAIDQRIAGRDYQQDCNDTLCREIGLGRRKMLVEMATGTGKTRTAAALIKRLFAANVVTRVLFLVDRIPLALQAEDTFTEHLKELPCYVLRAGRRFQDEQRITITTLQSMVNIYHEYSSGYFDLIITDECHRSIYGKWRKVLEHFDGIQIGLTATPCVKPPNEDGTPDEETAFVRDTLRFFGVDKPTFAYTLKRAIDEGYLVGYQIYKAQTVKTATADGIKILRDDIQWEVLDPKTRKELEDAFVAAANLKPPLAHILIDPNVLERKFTIPARNQAIVREFRKVMDEGFNDANGYLRKPMIGKTIVFAVTKRHAETLATLIDNEFAHLKPSPEIKYADYVVSGVGQGEDTTDAMARIRRFKKEKFPQVLVSVNMLDTGFDCPEVVNLIFARYTKSVTLYRQMLGRGTRKSPGKPVFTLFDFVGVVATHEGVDGYGEGGKVMEPKPRPYQNPRTLVTVDQDDYIDPTTRAWVTMDDAGNFVFLEASEEKANELGARFEGWLVSHDFTPDQERWLHDVEAQIRQNADQFDDFTLDHLEFPPFSLQGGRRKAAELFGGEESLSGVIANLSQSVYGEQPSTH